MSVVSLESFHSHTLVPEKHVRHIMDRVQQRAQMVPDCQMLITFCLYQQPLRVSELCLLMNYSYTMSFVYNYVNLTVKKRIHIASYKLEKSPN